MNLFLLSPSDVNGSRAVLRGHQARHALAVLRAQVGDGLRIGLLNGPRGTGVVVKSSAEEVELECSFDTAIPPRPAVDLLLALPRPKVMKRLWAQLAALGVKRIILTNAARVERNYFDTHILDPAFYTPLLLEGLQQAQDTHLPDISIHRQFKPLIEDELDSFTTEDAARLLADPASPGGLTLAAGIQRALLAVGPEGGWVPYERELLARRGFTPFGLGARTLRSDTACVALLSVVNYFMPGNLNPPGS